MTTKYARDAFLRAVQDGMEDAVRSYLDEDPSIAEMSVGGGLRPIHLAALSGRLGVVEVLISYGEPPDTLGPDRLTALHMAAGFGHLEVIALLLDSGADPDARTERAATPDDIAASKGEVEAQYLLTAALSREVRERMRVGGVTFQDWLPVFGEARQRRLDGHPLTEAEWRAMGRRFAGAEQRTPIAGPPVRAAFQGKSVDLPDATLKISLDGLYLVTGSGISFARWEDIGGVGQADRSDPDSLLFWRRDHYVEIPLAVGGGLNRSWSLKCHSEAQALELMHVINRMRNGLAGRSS